MRPTLNWRKIALLLTIFLFLFATFPGKGGLEGDQRNISGLENRTDNWGFIVPYLVGQWPNIFGHWRFSFVLFQLTIFWIGIYLLFRGKSLTSKVEVFSFGILILVSSIFVSQLWRDATLLAFSTFGFGIISISLEHKRRKRVLFFFVGVFFLHLAAMFKVLYGVILAALFLWLILQTQRPKKFLFISLSLIHI